MIDDGRLLVVTPNQLSPEIEEQLRLRFGMPVRTVLCTPAAFTKRSISTTRGSRPPPNWRPAPPKRKRRNPRRKERPNRKPRKSRLATPRHRSGGTGGLEEETANGLAGGLQFRLHGAMFAAALAGYTLNHLWLSLERRPWGRRRRRRRQLGRNRTQRPVKRLATFKKAAELLVRFRMREFRFAETGLGPGGHGRLLMLRIIRDEHHRHGGDFRHCLIARSTSIPSL